MKKILIMLVLLALVTPAIADTVTVVVSPPAVGDSYAPSEIILVEVIGSGFDTSPYDVVSYMTIEAVTYSGETAGTSSNPDLAPELKTGDPINVDPGTIVDDLGVCVAGIKGAVAGFVYADPLEPLWWMEWHVPDVPDSTFIEIGLDGLIVMDMFAGVIQGVTVLPAVIHVTPEPMTIALLGLGGLFLRRRK